MRFVVFSASLHVRAAGAEERDDGRADGYDDVAEQRFDFVVHCSGAVFGVVGFGLITLVGLPCGLRVRWLGAVWPSVSPSGGLGRVAFRSASRALGRVACRSASGVLGRVTRFGGVRCSPIGKVLPSSWGAAIL